MSRPGVVLFQDVVQGPAFVGAPQLAPPPGRYGPTTAVTITAPAGATIKYTVDGSTPSPSHGTTYTVPVSIAASKTLKAIAYNGTDSNSPVVSGLYTIMGPATTPTFDPVADTYADPQTVTISSNFGAAIYYTTDGSSPTTASTPYTAPVLVSVSETLKALAVLAPYSNSAIGSADYVIGGP